MKKVIIMMAVILGLLWLPKAAEAGIGNNLEFVHSFDLGVADYKFYNCAPNCGASIDAKGAWGMNETLFYMGFKNVHPGIQVGFARTISMHIHHPGGINDQIYYALAMVRVPNVIKRVNLYAGVGAHSQFTQIVLPDGGPADCNHGGVAAKAGAEYMVTKRVGVGVEYLFAKTHHDFSMEGGGETASEIKLNQDTRLIFAAFNFHF